MQKPIDDVPPDQNGNVPPNPNTVDPNADNINKSDKQKQEFSLTFTVTTDTDGNVEKKVNAPFDLTEDFYTDKNKRYYLRFGGQRTNPFVKRLLVIQSCTARYRFYNCIYGMSSRTRNA